MECEARTRRRLHRAEAVQPVAEVGADRTDQRERAEADARGPMEISELDLTGRLGDVAAIEEHHATDRDLPHRAESQAGLDADLEQRGAAVRDIGAVLCDDKRREPALAEAAMARRTNDWMLHQQFAELLNGFGDQEGAVGEWREVLGRVPDHLIAHFQLGRSLSLKAATAVEAEAELRAALALREDFVEAWEQLGEALSQQQKFAAADEAFGRAIELRPTFTEARANRALALQFAGRTNDAVATLRAAVAGDPNHLLSLGRLASLLTAVGESAEAAEMWERIVGNRPTFAAHIQAARAWEAVTNLSRAGPHWVAAVQANPAQPEARMGLALALAKTGHSDQACDELRELIKRTPTASSAHLNLGIILLSQKKTAEALTQFERAQELEPTSTKVRDYVQAVRALLNQELQLPSVGK